MTQPLTRASMADVAKLARVSAQTVSRVSNGMSNVSPATRERVAKAMQELNYRPNGAARALKRGQFRTLGVITITLGDFGTTQVLDAIAREATEADYAVTLIPLADHTLARVSGAYSRLSEQAVDGAILHLEAALIDHQQLLLPAGIPLVVVNSSAADSYTTVDHDHVLGARQATEHLLSLGHRQVWHVAGPEHSFSARLRAQSWQRTLQANGLDPPALLRGDWSADSGYALGLELGRSAEVHAIFAANDQMALGVLRALHELGRSVPNDVSVVGFDDMPEAASFWPPLTTVRQHFRQVGHLCVQKLLDKVAAREARPGTAGSARAGASNTDLGDSTLVATELIVRASTAAAAEYRSAGT